MRWNKRESKEKNWKQNVVFGFIDAKTKQWRIEKKSGRNMLKYDHTQAFRKYMWSKCILFSFLSFSTFSLSMMSSFCSVWSFFGFCFLSKFTFFEFYMKFNIIREKCYLLKWTSKANTNATINTLWKNTEKTTSKMIFREQKKYCTQRKIKWRATAAKLSTHKYKIAMDIQSHIVKTVHNRFIIGSWICSKNKIYVYERS